MKIYFNRKPVSGPWGGGSKILSSIVEECQLRGYQVFFEEQLLTTPNINLLVCIDPRQNQHIGFNHLLEYKKIFNSKIVQRVGDLGTHGKPDLLDLLKKTTELSDTLIFPSNWAKKYLNSKNSSQHVIKNAPLQQFITKKDIYKDFTQKINLVTHHWSNNSNKGFDLYKKLDNFCIKSDKFTFTYIGRMPADISLSNCIPPLDINGLINELPNHHIYITASLLEAGANHVLEAMAMNLPVLYHEQGGSINEYCQKNGFSYGSIDELIFILENHIETIQKTYLNLSDNRRSSKNMAEEYVNLFEKIS